MINFEELLDAIDDLSEEQRQILTHRLWVKSIPTPSSPTTVEDRLQAYRAKLYAQARRYWQSVGDTTRLALTDSQLDEQFWLIDGDGVPRLKEDQDKVEIPENSSVYLAELAESAEIYAQRPIDPALADDILNAEFGEYLYRRLIGDYDGARKIIDGQ